MSSVAAFGGPVVAALQSDPEALIDAIFVPLMSAGSEDCRFLGEAAVGCYTKLRVLDLYGVSEVLRCLRLSRMTCNMEFSKFTS